MARPISSDLAGLQLPPVTASWNQKDVMLYALGVGPRPPEDLRFVYEGRGPVDGDSAIVDTPTQQGNVVLTQARATAR